MRRRQLPGEPPPPSKAGLKREAQEVRDLADRLIAAPPAVVTGLGLPEKLAEAIALARSISSHAARVRQRLFVAKLMRGVDPQPIRSALEERDSERRREAARFRRAEHWRDRLVREGAAAIDTFLAEHPGADRAELERLARAATIELAGTGAAGAGRELFRYVSGAFSRKDPP